MSYWCWEDMSPFTNTLVQWLPNEPSDAGFCGYLAEPSQQGLKAATCINEVNGTVCERPGNNSYLVDFYFLESKGKVIYFILNQLLHDFAKGLLNQCLVYIFHAGNRNFKNSSTFTLLTVKYLKYIIQIIFFSIAYLRVAFGLIMVWSNLLFQKTKKIKVTF